MTTKAPMNTTEAGAVGRHFNKLTPAEAELLALLAEEMGEAIQAVGKILRHGYESRHPNGGPTNRETLERECGDVRHSMIRLCDAGDLSKAAIHAAADSKAAKIEQYLHHATGATTVVPQVDLDPDIQDIVNRRREELYENTTVVPAEKGAVAWMVKDANWNQCFTTKEQAEFYGRNLVPLYLHPAPTPTSAWLIERGPKENHLPHVWLTDDANWTPDAIKAKRFSTEAGARAYAEVNLWSKPSDFARYGAGYSITEHIFVDAPTTPPAPADRGLVGALAEVLDTRNAEAKALLAVSNATENYTGKVDSYVDAYAAASCAASEAERKARVLLASMGVLDGDALLRKSAARDKPKGNMMRAATTPADWDRFDPALGAPAVKCTWCGDSGYARDDCGVHKCKSCDYWKIADSAKENPAPSVKENTR